MKVTNHSNSRIKVSINRWGTSGDTSDFEIGKDQVELWERSDTRGFVMAVKNNGGITPYYVQNDSNIIIYDNEVRDNNYVIIPANKNRKSN